MDNRLDVYRGKLNSMELLCYDFIIGCGGGEVNSWDDFGRLLIKAFNFKLEVGDSVRGYIEVVSFGDYLDVLNSLVIKYLSYCEGVTYDFCFISDREYVLQAEGQDSISMVFRSMPNNPYHSKSVIGRVQLVRNTVITDIDRFLGLFDFGIRMFGTDKVFLKYINVDVSDVSLYGFRYRGKYHYSAALDMYRSSGVGTLSGSYTWQRYMDSIVRAKRDGIRLGIIGGDEDNVVAYDPLIDGI